MNQPKAIDFQLDKWFLDFTTEDGQAAIFYAAKLKWRGLTVPFTSWLNCSSSGQITNHSRFYHVNMPEIFGEKIYWADSNFKLAGTWTASRSPLHARLFESPEGWLHWNCHQPASNVQLKMNGQFTQGSGYAEQLIMTLPAWKIPMDELRWGRFVSQAYNMVWIELKEKQKQQWVWLNGEPIDNCEIDDHQIILPAKKLTLLLDQKVVLESEKKIQSVVEKIIRYIPGFNQVVPLHFLMADEHKWLSNGQLQQHGKTIATGMSIHELVYFKPERP